MNFIKRFKFFIILLITFLIFFFFLFNSRKQSNYEEGVVYIKDVEINVEIAITSEEKSKGLSLRNKLNKNDGMLFVFMNKSKPTFWMKDMKFPIDIIWISDNKIVYINENVLPPQPNTPLSKLLTYKPPVGVDYVLEVCAGFVRLHNIEIEDGVTLPDNI